MIIDAHTHLVMDEVLYGSLEATRGTGDEILIKTMDANDIAVSCLCTLDFRGPSWKANDELLAVVEKYQGRVLGFLSVDPRDGEGALAEMRRAHRLGLVGLKLHPWLQAFKADDPIAYPLIETATELGLPVFFHTGTPPYTQPLQCAVLARRYPECTIILGHMGLGNYYLDSIHAAEDCPNLWLETSAEVVPYAIEEAVRRLGPGRILFGSDGPLIDPGPEIAKIRALNISEADKAMILGQNAARLFGLH